MKMQLSVAKNLLRQGVDPSVITSLTPDLLESLKRFADLAADYNSTFENNPQSGGGAVPAVNDYKVDAQGTPLVLAPSIVSVEQITIGRAALDELQVGLKLASALPVEQFQATMIAIQAMMGPMKFVLSVAVSKIAESAYGDKIEEVKEGASIKLAAQLISENESELEQKNAAAKQKYKDDANHEGFDGDGYVVASRFLIDSLLGEVKSLGIKAGGKVIQIVKDSRTKPKVLGGAHRDTSKPVNDKLDSHHCPAQSCYTGAPISSKDGPAIKMDPKDHRNTASYGSSDEAVAYRAQQEKLLGEGKLKEAIDMDVIDIKSKFGNRYDDAIREMLEYASKLNPNDFKR